MSVASKSLIALSLLICISMPVCLSIYLVPSAGVQLGNTSASTVADTLNLFKELGFDARNDIRSGEPELPPVFLAELPEDLKTLKDLNTRKAVFVSIVLPHVLYANQRIGRDREKLEQLHEDLSNQLPILNRDRKWLKRMAKTYRTSRLDTITLLRRIDIVPPRLAVAQAVQESGWGTSRFAQDGNALFGQHAPVGPGAIRASGDNDVALKTFDTLQDSVSDYMRNLNRHRAYRGFRTARAGMRASNRPLDPVELANTLSQYSEEGDLYVGRLIAIMNMPEVDAAKNAVLRRKR